MQASATDMAAPTSLLVHGYYFDHRAAARLDRDADVQPAALLTRDRGVDIRADVS
jgi:hypothetical protein